MVRAPARLELDNPSVTFSAAYADTWQKWFDEFVLQGRQEEEKTGTITFLAPNMKDAVASLKLVNLGIFRLADEPQDTSKEGIHRVTAGLYCERMELKTFAAL